MQLRRFVVTCLAIALVILATFGVFSALGLEAALERTLQEQGQSEVLTAAVGVSLLIADVFLPVPSSLVMLLFGRLFGVVLGAALSLIGGVGATALGMLVGRFARRSFRRQVGDAEYAGASQLLDRYGALAVLATRPVPILAETVALVAGATGMPFGRGLWAATLGALPGAFLYAWAGASDLSGPTGVITFCGVILLSSVTYLVGRRSRVGTVVEPRAR
jgi:uncharacterized membrane protein YdjX (TVP38/TMEM64 family)